MIKHEAKCQIIFKHWLQSGAWDEGSAVFELKQTQGKSIPFSDVKEHQELNLVSAETGLYYKIPDDSMGEKPFDCFCLKGVKGYVVLFFKKTFYIIEIHTFIKCKAWSNRASITEEMAKNIAIHRISTSA